MIKDYPSYLDYPRARKPMTNADHIRSMTDEELAEKFADLQLCASIKDLRDTGLAGEIKQSIKGEIEKTWLRWMKQSYKEAT